MAKRLANFDPEVDEAVRELEHPTWIPGGRYGAPRGGLVLTDRRLVFVYPNRAQWGPNLEMPLTSISGAHAIASQPSRSEIIDVGVPLQQLIVEGEFEPEEAGTVRFFVRDAQAWVGRLRTARSALARTGGTDGAAPRR